MTWTCARDAAIALASIGAVSLLIDSGVAAQTTETLRREAPPVVSVKPTGRKDGPIVFADPPDGFTAQNTNVAQLILMAYGNDFLKPLEGAPAWVYEDRFDVMAKVETRLADAAPGNQARQLMVRALLAERFKLSMHAESRALPIYALVLARPDRALGPQLRPTSTDCFGHTDERGIATACVSTGYGLFKAEATSLGTFAFIMSTQLGRRVEDRTGLHGTFAIDLEYAPLRTPPADATQAPVNPDRPSLFTAVQEQLGLKLDATHGPVDVLVIDHIERPSPN